MMMMVICRSERLIGHTSLEPLTLWTIAHGWMPSSPKRFRIGVRGSPREGHTRLPELALLASSGEGRPLLMTSSCFCLASARRCPVIDLQGIRDPGDISTRELVKNSLVHACNPSPSPSVVVGVTAIADSLTVMWMREKVISGIFLQSVARKL